MRDGKVDGAFTVRRIESDLESQPEMSADSNGCHHLPPTYQASVVYQGVASMGVIVDPAGVERIEAAFGVGADLATLANCR